MIIRNEQKYFGVGFHGVVHSANFKCALDTVYGEGEEHASSIIHSLQGEWDGNNSTPVAEALLMPNLPNAKIRDIHDRFLSELSELGDDGLSLGDVIEEIFGIAKRSNIVVDYENNALLLISSPESALKNNGESYDYLLYTMRKVEEDIGVFPVAINGSGSFAVHPALQRELDRPVNRGLKATLSSWLNGGSKASS